VTSDAPIDRRDFLYEIQQRGVSRLCHFTPIGSLRQITADGNLYSTAWLRERNPNFQGTDPERYDGYRDHVCCSVQYPNLRYLRRLLSADGEAANKWVILLLNPELVTETDTGFCVVNAAEQRGSRVARGFDAFKSMFSGQVVSYAGGGNRQFQRSQHHLPSCPTAIQAEVLIPQQIPNDVIIGAVVRSAAAVPVVSALLDSESTRGIPVQEERRMFDCEQIEQCISTGRELRLHTRQLGDCNG